MAIQDCTKSTRKYAFHVRRCYVSYNIHYFQAIRLTIELLFRKKKVTLEPSRNVRLPLLTMLAYGSGERKSEVTESVFVLTHSMRHGNQRHPVRNVFYQRTNGPVDANLIYIHTSMSLCIALLKATLDRGLKIIFCLFAHFCNISPSMFPHKMGFNHFLSFKCIVEVS